MNNTKSLNKKFKTKQFKAVLRLVVLIFTIISLLIGAAWSWFADQKEATASGISMTMQTADFLAVSIDGGNTFHSSIDILNDPMFDELNLRDVTGSGSSFLIPEFSGSIGALTVDTDINKTWATAVANKDYISLDLTFRSSFPADIYVAKGTQVITKCEEMLADGQINPNVLVGANTYNKSAYGDFSKDAIVGALRMAAYDSSSNFKFVWIPRPDVLLTVSDDLQNYTLDVGDSITDTSTREHNYYNSSHHPVKANDAISSCDAFTADVGITPESATTKITATTTYSDGFYTGKAHINIWFEGRDSEARRALSDGEFNIFLNFVAIPNS